MKKLSIMFLSVLLSLILGVVLISCGGTGGSSEVDSTLFEDPAQVPDITEYQTELPVITDVVTDETQAPVCEEVTTDTELATTEITETTETT